MRRIDPNYRSSGGSEAEFSDEDIAFNDTSNFKPSPELHHSPNIKMSKFYEVRPHEVLNFL